MHQVYTQNIQCVSYELTVIAQSTTLTTKKGNKPIANESAIAKTTIFTNIIKNLFRTGSF